LLDFLKTSIASFQDFLFLAGRAFRNIVRSPHYYDDVFMQMDIIGVGSLPIVILIGAFSGAIIALQMARALSTYGASSQVGTIVSLTLVRELGPVLSAVMVAGRNASGIASELGSMKVTEQIDAMRALGTDPTRKLVTPRLVATVFMLFFLTIISDAVGIAGGALVSVAMLNLNATAYIHSSYASLAYGNIVEGLTKAIFSGFIIATVGCFYGMRTQGGTQGVGKATTQAVVVSSVFIIVVDFLTSRLMISIFGS